VGEEWDGWPIGRTTCGTTTKATRQRGLASGQASGLFGDGRETKHKTKTKTSGSRGGKWEVGMGGKETRAFMAAEGEGPPRAEGLRKGRRAALFYGSEWEGVARPKAALPPELHLGRNGRLKRGRGEMRHPPPLSPSFDPRSCSPAARIGRPFLIMRRH
jgi:hypothetical protein